MAYNAGQELSSLAFDKIIGGALDAVVNAQNNSSMTTVSFIKSVGFKASPNGEKETPVYVDFKYPKEIAPFQPAEKRIDIKISNGGSNYVSELTVFKIAGKEIDVDLEIVEGVIKSASLRDQSQVEKVADKTTFTVECKAVEGDSGSGAAAEIIVTKTDAVPANFQEMTLQIPLLTMMPIPFIRIESTDIEFNVKINSINTTVQSESSNNEIKSATTGGYNSWWSPVRVNTSFNTSFSSQKQSSSTEEIKKEFSLNIKIHAVQDEMPAGVSKVLDILEESIISRPSVK